MNHHVRRQVLVGSGKIGVGAHSPITSKKISIITISYFGAI